MVNVFRNQDGSLDAKKTIIKNSLNKDDTISIEARQLANKFNPPIKVIDTQHNTARGVDSLINQAM